MAWVATPPPPPHHHHHHHHHPKYGEYGGWRGCKSLQKGTRLGFGCHLLKVLLSVQGQSKSRSSQVELIVVVHRLYSVTVLMFCVFPLRNATPRLWFPFSIVIIVLFALF